MGCDYVSAYLKAGIRIKTIEYPRFISNLIKEWQRLHPGKDILDSFVLGEEEADSSSHGSILCYFLGIGWEVLNDFNEKYLSDLNFFAEGEGCTKELESIIGNEKWRVTIEAIQLMRIISKRNDLSIDPAFSAQKDYSIGKIKSLAIFFGDIDSSHSRVIEKYYRSVKEIRRSLNYKRDPSVEKERTGNRKKPKKDEEQYIDSLDAQVSMVVGPYEKVERDGSTILIYRSPLTDKDTKALDSLCVIGGIKNQYCIYHFHY